MTNFNYGDIIEYIDCTFDDYFEDAKHWCQANNAELVELVDKREQKGEVLYRYFQIKEFPKYEPSEEELKMQVRLIRNSYLSNTDFTQLPDSPFTAEGKAQYAEYREYLRNYTDTSNWWLQNPKTFEEWKS